ncbi:helix-turn-helix domain-containing protein [Mycolicibacterium sphagni]|uniref:helix-turn-helix domain-containing protein n=1 Tax=Mycolicibacterium sphagni TaxID=1786 RepID=UPI0021F2F0A2|nr:hypothetical protein [Mycolicibacterium sphagni]MCV7174901.1 hypothetical protein [Mycolicibacterium sphagni]
MDPDDHVEWLLLEDIKFRVTLKQKRLESGLTLEGLARAAGPLRLPFEMVEDLSADPPLSLIRRYAAAVGVHYLHRVAIMDPPPDNDAVIPDIQVTVTKDGNQ